MIDELLKEMLLKLVLFLIMFGVNRVIEVMFWFIGRWVSLVCEMMVVDLVELMLIIGSIELVMLMVDRLVVLMELRFIEVVVFSVMVMLCVGVMAWLFWLVLIVYWFIGRKVKW